MRNLLVSAEVQVLRPTRRFLVKLPLSLNEKLQEVRPVISKMFEEAPEHVIYQGAVHDLSLEYLKTAPGTSVAMDVCCAGTGVKVSGSAVYYIPRYVGSTLPSGGIPVYKYEKGVTEEQGRIVDYGRMGGPFGWSRDKNLIAGALASFRHNWVGLLALFRERPRLPSTEAWVLPNMTLEETKAPDQLVLPASYRYTLWRPATTVFFTVNTSSATPTKVGLDWWDANKETLARVEEIELPEGDNVIKAILRGPPFRIRTGYFTVNPIDAPKGMTVVSVTTTPTAI